MTNPVPINDRCPWSNDPVSSDSLTTYRGNTVGFCNPGCRDKFDKAVHAFEAALDALDIHTPMKAAFTRLARYNHWMNNQLYDAVAPMPEDAYRRDLGAFFKSVHGTLNHILVWDTTWLQRFAEHEISYSSLAPIMEMERPTSHDQILFDDFSDLKDARLRVDHVLQDFIMETSERDYASVFTYVISTGDAYHKNFGGMIQHLFNHQTHHRGQITTLLWQQGIDPGVTDLLATLPDMKPSK